VRRPATPSFQSPSFCRSRAATLDVGLRAFRRASVERAGPGPATPSDPLGDNGLGEALSRRGSAGSRPLRAADRAIPPIERTPRGAVADCGSDTIALAIMRFALRALDATAAGK